MSQSVLMLSWEYPPRIVGGLSRVVENLSIEMSKAGWSVDVITFDHPGAPEQEVLNGVNVHRVKSQTDTTPDFITWIDRMNFGLLQHAIKLQTQKPFSIIHAHDWMVADAAWTMKSGFDIPLVSTIHATEAGRMHGIHTDLQRYIHQMEWRLTYESWEVIVNSHSMFDELQSLFDLPQNKINVIPNGINPEVFDFPVEKEAMRRQIASPDDKIILYVGRMVAEKGVNVLLDAAPSIIANMPNTRFILVGSGYYLEDLKRQSHNLGLDQHVIFPGYVSDDHLKNLYKIADVVVIPSLYEPFGIVALEGMAAKAPVVSSDAGGLTDFVEHMQTGITTYKGDPGSLAWGVLEVLRNRDLANHLINNAYERVGNVYHWKSIAKRTTSVYQRIIKQAQESRSKPKVSGKETKIRN